MKAFIKIVTDNKEFNKEQLDILRRATNWINQYEMHSRVIIKKKITKTKILKIKHSNKRSAI